MLARASYLSALLVVLAGCAPQFIEGNYTCADPDKGHLGPDGTPDPCHYQVADAGGDPRCAVGEYIHYPLQWAPPTLLWFGQEEQAPECPLGPKTTSYEGHADLVAPTVCEACTCQPPTGSCALPSTLTASMAVCYTPGAPPPASFNAPTPWDGQCDSTNQVPAGVAHSLTIGALTIMENGCVTGPTIPAKVISLRWDTYARTCDMDWPSGATQRSICLPDSPIPPGFRFCVFHDGEQECPALTDNVFTERHVFYNDVEDNRQCSACSCGAPTGSACTATISIYKNANCSALLDQKTISSASETCTDIQLPGQALGSKKAGPTTFLPGICPAIGGDASGSAIETNPVTLCCRP